MLQWICSVYVTSTANINNINNNHYQANYYFHNNQTNNYNITSVGGQSLLYCQDKGLGFINLFSRMIVPNFK